MTTKEFKFRSAEYVKLDMAAYLFSNSTSGYIYHVICITSDSDKFELYSDIPSLSINYKAKSFACKSLWFDKFSRSDFEIQLRYFKGFLNRLSELQKSILTNSHSVDNLLKFCNEG